MGKIFEVLNDNAHRNARIRLYIAAKNYYKFRSTDDKKEIEECGTKLKKVVVDKDPTILIPESANIVLSDFDWLGALVKNSLINEQDVLKIYWNTIISSYDVLTEDKEKIGFYPDFGYLCSKAISYRNKIDQYQQKPLEKDLYSKQVFS